MPAPGTRNVVYVLVNGGPNEYAVARDVPDGENPDEVMLVKFDQVPDELCDFIVDTGKPSHRWEELCALPHEAI